MNKQNRSKGATSLRELSNDVYTVQKKRCGTYGDFLDPSEKCTDCTRKFPACRFQDVRHIILNEDGKIKTSFIQASYHMPKYKFPVKYHSKITEEQKLTILETVVRALTPILEEELSHMKNNDAIQKPPEDGTRPLCDICLTTIFSGCWICKRCGYEVCLECYDNVDGPTAKRCKLSSPHEKSSFIAITRHRIKDFEAALSEMNPFQKTPLVQEPCSEIDKYALFIPQSEMSLSYIREPLAQICVDSFRRLWAKGEALVITGIQPRIQWTPSFFSEKYGWEDVHETEDFRRGSMAKAILVNRPVECLVVDCVSGDTKPILLIDYFKLFDSSRDPKRGAWKLKDWPPGDTFEVAFPDLYDDFQSFVPFPEITHLRGVLNLATRFPRGFLKPDLGPKLYCALASSDGPGGKGTTNLHLDIADAVNVMVYAEDYTGFEGAASWDIYPAGTAMILRKFLIDYAKTLPPSALPSYSLDKNKVLKDTFDPIHAQIFYLDKTLRDRLFQEYGVVGWRIYQKPGEAVFIPAGCPHQVANLTDCIKIASDFVSPQNVDRCMSLSGEHSKLLWKEDILQLKNALWFCWLDGISRHNGRFNENAHDWQKEELQEERAQLKYVRVEKHVDKLVDKHHNKLVDKLDDNHPDKHVDKDVAESISKVDNVVVKDENSRIDAHVFDGLVNGMEKTTCSIKEETTEFVPMDEDHKTPEKDTQTLAEKRSSNTNKRKRKADMSVSNNQQTEVDEVNDEEISKLNGKTDDNDNANGIATPAYSPPKRRGGRRSKIKQEIQSVMETQQEDPHLISDFPKRKRGRPPKKKLVERPEEIHLEAETPQKSPESLPSDSPKRKGARRSTRNGKETPKEIPLGTETSDHSLDSFVNCISHTHETMQEVESCLSPLSDEAQIT